MTDRNVPRRGRGGRARWRAAPTAGMTFHATGSNRCGGTGHWVLRYPTEYPRWLDTQYLRMWTSRHHRHYLSRTCNGDETAGSLTGYRRSSGCESDCPCRPGDTDRRVTGGDVTTLRREPSESVTGCRLSRELAADGFVRTHIFREQIPNCHSMTGSPQIQSRGSRLRDGGASEPLFVDLEMVTLHPALGHERLPAGRAQYTESLFDGFIGRHGSGSANVPGLRPWPPVRVREARYVTTHHNCSRKTTTETRVDGRPVPGASVTDELISLIVTRINVCEEYKQTISHC